MSLAAMLRCFHGILWRELLRFLHQYTRFVAALVRPLIWLFVFAAGFRSVLGVSIVLASSLDISRNQRGIGLVSSTRMLPSSRS